MPDAPVQILANGSGSTPASPVQIAGNGSASSPAAPPAVSSSSANLGPGVIVGGPIPPLVPNVAGFLPLVEIDATGRPIYGTAAGPIPTYDPATRVFYTGTRWELVHYGTGLTGAAARWQSATGTAATPDLASGWAPAEGDIETERTPTFTVISKAAPVWLPTDGDDLANVVVSGTGSPSVAGLLRRVANGPDGYPAYSSDGFEAFTSSYDPLRPPSGTRRILYWKPADGWFLQLVRPLLPPDENETWICQEFGDEDGETPRAAYPWMTGTWVALSESGASGTPVFTRATGSPAEPVQVAANGSGSTPAAPPAII